MSTRFPVIINGMEAGRGDNGQLSIFDYIRGSQVTINAYLIDPATDFGFGLTGDTVILKVYEDYRKRKEAEGGPAQVGGSDDGVLAEVTASASTSSVAVLTIADTDTNFNALTILPRQNYYAEIHLVDSSDSNRIKKSLGFEFKVV